MSPSSSTARSPQSPKVFDAGLSSMMFEDALRIPLSVRQQILLMSIILTLSNLALCMTRNSRVYLFEQAQCLLYYQSHDPTHLNSQDSIKESLCKLDDIQYPLSILVGADSFLSLVPAILVLPTYKFFLPAKGLRSLLLLNLSCSALGVLFSTFVFWLRQPWAIYAAPFSFMFDLVGGGEMVRLTLIPTCVAEISDPDKLTKIYNYLSGTYLLAGVGGAAFGSLLLPSHVYLLNALSILCFALTALIAILVPYHCGRDLNIIEDLVPNLSPIEEDLPSSSSPIRWQRNSSKPSTQLSLLRIIIQSWQASYQSLKGLFHTPHPTFTVISIILINGLAMNVQVLFAQYTSLVLQWSFAKVNSILALKALVSALVLFFLPTIRRIFLEPRMTTAHIDLLIIQGSLVFNLIGMAGIGFSMSAGLFIISLCVFTSGTGLMDSLYAYGTLSLPPGENITEFYLRLGLVQTIAGLFGAPLWSVIFSLVLKSGVLPFGLPFWLCSGLFGSALVGAGTLKRRHDTGL